MSPCLSYKIMSQDLLIRPFLQLILNISVPRLPRIQPKDNTCICLNLMRAPWDQVDRRLMDIRQTLNFPPNFHVVRKHNRITREAKSSHACIPRREQALVEILRDPTSHLHVHSIWTATQFTAPAYWADTLCAKKKNNRRLFMKQRFQFQSLMIPVPLSTFCSRELPNFRYINILATYLISAVMQQIQITLNCIRRFFES